MTIISRDYPDTQDIICVSGRVTFSFWDVVKLLFQRKIVIVSKTYVARPAGERLHKKVSWHWDV